MSQVFGFRGDFHSFNGIPHAVAIDDNLRRIIKMSLGANPPRECLPDQFHVRRKVLAIVVFFAKHERSDFASPDAAGKAKLAA